MVLIFELKNEVSKVNSNANKRMLKCQPFCIGSIRSSQFHPSQTTLEEPVVKHK